MVAGDDGTPTAAGVLEAYKRDAALAAEYLEEAVRGPAFAECVRSYQQKQDPVFGDVQHDPRN